MKLKVLLPNEVFLDQEVTKVLAEAQDGYFCLLPRHIDFVAALVPGILMYEGSDRQQRFVAIDEGTLVKCGNEVLVSIRNAASGGVLGDLRELIAEQFEKIDERERMARSASARLEAGLVRRFMEFDKHGPR
jgi:F-type H+-transporting ATPase subunit epsilon